MRVSCPRCSKSLTLPDEAAGRVALCPDCQAKFRLPGGPRPDPARAKPGAAVNAKPPNRPTAARPSTKGAARPRPAIDPPAPRRRPAPSRDDEDSPAVVRRRNRDDDDDEVEDDRPKRRRRPRERRRAASFAFSWGRAFLGLSVILFILLLGVIAWPLLGPTPIQAPAPQPIQQPGPGNPRPNKLHPTRNPLTGAPFTANVTGDAYTDELLEAIESEKEDIARQGGRYSSTDAQRRPEIQPIVVAKLVELLKSPRKATADAARFALQFLGPGEGISDRARHRQDCEGT